MELRVRLFAALRERAGADEIVVADLPLGLDIAALKRELERQRPELGSLKHVAGVIGTRYVDDATRVQPGDRVSLLPPVSGGAPSRPSAGDLARGVFELCAEHLDPVGAQTRVRDHACGALVQFVGTTRSENRGRQVVQLEYEAFQEMSAAEMERIFERCRAHLDEPAQALLCQHRVGVVEVGEPSVVITVASVHRAQAFHACRFLIDALKQSLPIWKKEIYADGHFWIGDRS